MLREIFFLVLGSFLLFFVLISFAKPKWKIPTKTPFIIFGGGISGFFAGLIGTGGALRAAFLAGMKLSKEKYLATLAAIALAVDATRIPIYFIEGFLSKNLFWMIPILITIAFLGAFIGEKIVKKISYNFSEY